MRGYSQVTRQLREEGVVVLRSAIPLDSLTCLKNAAEACFDAIARAEVDARKYRFTPFGYSVTIEALRAFGTDDLMDPIRVNGIDGFASEMMGEKVECRPEESWVRKRFAPCNAPPQYHANSWHQDGGLGVHYGADGKVGPMTRLLTCWIPLHDCNGQRPGLEFVRQRLPGLLHYRDLEDNHLRQRFAEELFWAPHLELGDGLLFLADSLHRTHARPEMRSDRLNLEYRFFPATG